jgi:hypothetical protein
LSAGQSSAFVVTVGSEGLDAASDVEVGGPAPIGFTITGFDASPDWTCTLGPSSWTCTRSASLPTGSADVVRLVGSVTADGGSPIDAAASVSTSTLELDLSDNDDAESLVARGLSLLAAAECVLDAPWLTLDTTTLGFTPGPGESATVTWRTLDGTIVQTDVDVPLDGARLLWPGAAVDGDGRGIAWPGWTQIDGVWVEVDDDRDGTLMVEVAVNPTATTTVTYPEATTDCAARPTFVDDPDPAPGPDPSGSGSGNAPAAQPDAEAGQGGSGPEADVAGVADGTLPRTGDDLAAALALAAAFLVVGAALLRSTNLRSARTR